MVPTSVAALLVKVPRVVPALLTEVEGTNAVAAPEVPTETVAVPVSSLAVTTFKITSTICEPAGMVATTWFIKDGNQNIGAGLTSYGYAGHLDDPDVPTGDINFGVPNKLYFSLSITYPSANLFNGFWSDYVAEITDKDSKLLTCYLYLKITDIYGLDYQVD